MINLENIVLFDDERNLLVNFSGQPLAALNPRFTTQDDGDFIARVLNFEQAWPGVLEDLMEAHEIINSRLPESEILPD